MPFIVSQVSVQDYRKLRPAVSEKVMLYHLENQW